MKQPITETYNLSFLYPKLIKEWDFSKNIEDPSKLAPKTHRKVWWKCSNNHEWEMRVKDRVMQEQGCPYCCNKKINNENSFAYHFPLLLKEWNDNKISPNEVSPKSGKKVSWKCEKGHEWRTEVRVRADGSRCPFCTGNRTDRSMSLGVKYPEIAKEWSNKNIMSPFDVLPASNLKVWWKCNKEHEWETFIYNRIGNKVSCPTCGGYRITDEKNLAALFPEIIKEWDFSKNIKTPDKVFPYSHDKVSWKCEKGHEWSTAVYNRTGKSQSGCPKCAYLVSSEEEEVASWLEQHISIIKNDRKTISPKELDIFVPSKNFAVEYNGLYFHSISFVKKEHHSSKTRECANKGITLFHIFSDEWRDKQPIVKSMLLHRLGLSRQRIFARKCEVRRIDASMARKFFDETHISGFSPSKVVFGLFYKNELVSAVSLRVPRHQKKYEKTIEIGRFASKLGTNVVGGFSKVLAHLLSFAKENGYKNILTYADKRFSVGNTYLKSGFQLVGETKEDYWYTDGETRTNRFQLRATKEKTEKQVAMDAGVEKVYGCGSLIFLMPIL